VGFCVGCLAMVLSSACQPDDAQTTRGQGLLLLCRQNHADESKGSGPYPGQQFRSGQCGDRRPVSEVLRTRSVRAGTLRISPRRWTVPFAPRRRQCLGPGRMQRPEVPGERHRRFPGFHRIILHRPRSNTHRVAVELLFRLEPARLVCADIFCAWSYCVRCACDGLGLQPEARRLFLTIALSLRPNYVQNLSHRIIGLWNDRGCESLVLSARPVTPRATHDGIRLNRVPGRCRQYSTRQ
jgi:hypothetical protein